MKALKLGCVLFFIGLSSYSQKNESNSTENRNSYLTFSIWPIADPFAPRFRFGYVQHVAAHWKVGLDVGLGTKELSFAPKNNIGEKYFLWEVRPEIHYIFKPEAKTLKYLSVEFFYIDQDHVFVDGDYTSEDNGRLRYDMADFSRQKYGLHLKFGLFLNVGERLGFNFFGGIGFRFADKQYSNVINPREDDFLRGWFAGPYETEGKDFRPNPSLGIKFYYKI